MEVLHITNDTFEQEVLNSDKPVLLDFWASWCGPCRMLAPVLDELAAENPDIKVVKINTDEQMELATRFNVMSIPALFVIKDGRITNQTVGVQSKERLLELLGKG